MQRTVSRRAASGELSVALPREGLVDVTHRLDGDLGVELTQALGDRVFPKKKIFESKHRPRKLVERSSRSDEPLHECSVTVSRLGRRYPRLPPVLDRHREGHVGDWPHDLEDADRLPRQPFGHYKRLDHVLVGESRRLDHLVKRLDEAVEQVLVRSPAS